MKFLLFLLLSFSVLPCSENYEPAPELDPGLSILKELRDMGVDVERSLKELSIGRTNLGPMTLVNWQTEMSASDQIHEFGKYLRRSILKKEKDFKVLGFEGPHQKALDHFESQIQAYQKVMWANRKLWQYSKNNIIENIKPGEVIYLIQDNSDTYWGSLLKLYNETQEFTKSVHINHFVVDGQKFKLRDDLSVQLELSPVTSFGKDNAVYQMVKIILREI